MNNRVEILLKEIRETIDGRRARGEYPVGYESSIETEHLELFGIDTNKDQWLNEQLRTLKLLQTEINAWSAIEQDGSRNKIIRLIREVAMSRHQLRRMNLEIARINHLMTEILISLVEEATLSHARRTMVLSAELQAVSERTQMIDGIVVIVRGLEKQVSELQAQIQNQK